MTTPDHAGSDAGSADAHDAHDAHDAVAPRGSPSADGSSDGDDNLLASEDERERLLAQQPARTPGRFRTRGLASKRGYPGAYEMEEGIGAPRPSSSSPSSSPAPSHDQPGSQHKARRRRLWRRLALYIAILVLFVVLLSVSYNLSTPADAKGAVPMTSNGTSMFAPTTLLISLDGFRADFLYRNLTPTLNSFIAEGVSPKYMLPSFPSVTFPNHYTMATGLYPEAHGVVGNTFWDPSLEKEFYYTDPERSLQAHWWGGEPLWVTAEKQKVRTAVHMWPGSEAHINDVEVAYVDKYNGSEKLPRKVDRILGLLDLPGPEDAAAKSDEPRPRLIAAYVPNVDADGHKYGPNSTEIRQTIKNADSMLGAILDGLHERNLTDIVNVVVVSDHGMATTDISRLIQLEDLVDPSQLEHIDGWPLYGLRPKKEEDIGRIYRQLKAKAEKNPNIEVYHRDKDMPERYHFSNNERIAPLWIIPKTGWAIVDRNEFDIDEGKKKGDVYHPRGLHGYDFEHPLMRAIFVARGPAFPHKPNSRLEPFQNIELYNIICDSVGFKPASNNGTLRLPLEPVGLHNDTTLAMHEIPADPVNGSLTTMDSLSSLTASASGLDDAKSSITQMRPGSATNTTTGAPQAETIANKEDWWEWLTHKADHMEEWVESFLHEHMPGDDDKKGEKG